MSVTQPLGLYRHGRSVLHRLPAGAKLTGLMVLGVAASLLWGLVRRPDNLFSLGPAL